MATALDQDLAVTGAPVLAKALPNSQVAVVVVVDPALTAIARLNRPSPKPILCKLPYSSQPVPQPRPVLQVNQAQAQAVFPAKAVQACLAKAHTLLNPAKHRSPLPVEAVQGHSHLAADTTPITHLEPGSPINHPALEFTTQNQPSSRAPHHHTSFPYQQV